MRSVTLIIISLLALLAPHRASGQITQTSQNWKGEEWWREILDNYQDTVLIVFDTEQELVTVKEVVIKTGTTTIDDVVFEKNYPPPPDNGCRGGLTFRHMHNFPIASEEYLIDKAGLSEDIPILYDSAGTDFSFWSKKEGELLEKTLLLVEAKEWDSRERNIRAVGVMMNTPFCDRIYEIEEQ